MSDDSVFVEDIIEATKEGIIRAYECTKCNNKGAVSYTHLTLPTNREV